MSDFPPNDFLCLLVGMMLTKSFLARFNGLASPSEFLVGVCLPQYRGLQTAEKAVMGDRQTFAAYRSVTEKVA
jgi:hypothetical protein